MKREHVTALAVGGAVVLAGTAAFAAIYPPWTWHPVPPRTLRGIGRPMTNREQLERYANSPGEWTRIPASGLPADARQVPIRAIRRTPMYAGQPGTKHWLSQMANRAAFVATLNGIRAALQEAGRGDEDARCVSWLWMLETGWFEACFNYCPGNIKHRPFASRESILGPDPHVWTTIPEAGCVFFQLDRVRSFDSYAGFNSFADYARREKRLFEWSNYAGRAGGVGVLGGYRMGGLEGLKIATRARHEGLYSPGELTAKLISAEQYWRMGETRARDAWVR